MSTSTSGVATSWTELSSAIELFTTGTLGTYTTVYNDGASLYGGTGQICLNHTSTAMNFMFDCIDISNDTTFPLMRGTAGESAMFGEMATGTCVSGTNLLSQTGRAHATESPSLATELRASNWCAAQCMHFDGGIGYTFFGDTPGTGGDDYFHMVLEVLPGLFTHWWTGQVNSDLTEMAPSQYGGFMGNSGPYKTSNTIAMRKTPLSASGFYDAGRDCREYFHFPKGVSAGQIDVSTPNINWAIHTGESGEANADWAIRTIGVGSGYNKGPWCCGTDPVSGRIITETPRLILPSFDGTQAYYPGIVQKYVPVGLIPGVRYCVIDSLLAKDTFDIGPKEFMAFPTGKRSSEATRYTLPQDYRGWTEWGWDSNDGYDIPEDNPNLDTGYEGFAYENN